MNSQNRTHHYLANNDTTLIEVANYLYSHILYVLLIACVVSALVGTWSAFFTAPKYASSSTVIYNLTTRNPLDAEISNYWNIQAEIDNKLYVLSVFANSNKFKNSLAMGLIQPKAGQSSEVKEAVKNLQLYLKTNPRSNPNEIADFFANTIEVSIDPLKRLVKLNATHTSPIIAKSTADLASATLVDMNYEMIMKEMNSVLLFIDEQTAATKDKLSLLEEELAKLQSNERIMSVNDLSSKVDTIRMDQRILQKRLSFEQLASTLWIGEVEKAIREFKTSLKSNSDSHLYMLELKRRLDLLFYQKTLSGDRQVASIEPNEINSALDATLGEFKRTLERETSQNVMTDPWQYLKSLEDALTNAKNKTREAKTQLIALNRETASADRLYNTLPFTLKKISQLKRDIDLTSNLYEQLKSKLQETQIRKSGKANDLEILYYGDMPEKTLGLSIWNKYIFSGVGTICILLLILTLRYMLIPTIRSRNDLAQTGVEVIAEVPYARLVRNPGESGDIHSLVLNINMTSDEANAIRQARFNLQEKLHLQQSRERKEAKVITVCSASSKEGKSFVSSNLAHALSLAQFRVLLLDLDILNSSAKRYFEPLIAYRQQPPSAESGQFHFVKTNASDYIDIVEVPRSEQSITDLLESPMLGEYLKAMREQYDVIIIDTPPLRNSLEALIASRYSDALIFVANQRASLRHDVLKAINTIQATYNKQIFAIINFSYDELNISRRRIKHTAIASHLGSSNSKAA